MSKISFIPALIACLSLGLFAAVGSAIAKEAPEKILVGSHLPLTGPMSAVGAEQKWAYEQALADVNKDGGVYIKMYDKKIPLELIVLDDETDAKKAGEVTEKLITEHKVDFILGGHDFARGVQQGLLAAEKHQQYYHGTAAFVFLWETTDPKYTTMLFFDIFESCGIPYRIWENMPENERPKVPAMFVEGTTDGDAFVGVINDQAAKNGFEAVEIRFDPKTTDYTEQIYQAKAANVDAIFIYADATDTAALARSMRDNDWAPKYAHGWVGTWPIDFWNLADGAGQYFVCDGHWSNTYPFPGCQELGERYEAAFGQPSVSVGAWYGVAQTFLSGLAQAESLEPLAVRQAVIDNEHDTVLGKIKYTPEGSAIYPAPAFQWIDGKQVNIWPRDLAVGELQWIAPWQERK